ncbi:predicted protein [Naegleria gruberi]|uniref:Predicted protein n=1 Tax=Naegleria gruberi TaxID=5762 RepID=D2VJZ7_NAEGR|nr:uncharacterized protein NAEGRDRAFT_69217 [Naegleria gruberi]EFC42858.1 predicted protein [Naegleria gruberi]|eukprot:XP_002675602.1 predicted protein [Naegleria gruberi strain NEG-M]
MTATSDEELIRMRQLKSSLYEPKLMTPLSSEIFNWQGSDASEKNKILHVRNGLTFTPYAFARICNANCHFCSENLERMQDENPSSKKKMNSYPTKRIKDYDQYFKGLEKSFQILDNIQKEKGKLNMGLSLSGLEATSEPNWFQRFCELLERYPDLFDEKVLYSNGSGFALYAQEVVDSLKNLNFDRIELSRQHFDEQVNQKIMRFEKVQPIRLNDIYENVTKNVLPPLFKVVKNSCILTKAGISNIEQVEQYLEWAINLGVKRVVFRELSVIGEEGYDNQNKTKRWIDENRVTISSVLSQVAPTFSNVRKNFNYMFTTIGYYYMNESYRYKDSIDVIFETSSYDALASSFDKYPNVVNKLIFHPNGNLSSDWEQDSNIVGKFF